MSGTIQGKLVIVNNELKVVIPTKKGGMQTQKISVEQLHPTLKRTPINQHQDLEVDLELYQGQPRRVRPVGSSWEEGATLPQNQVRTQGRRNLDNSRDVQQIPGDFHNPYNFVPAPPRKTNHPDLGDHEPVGHGVYYPNRWSGQISVKLTTITPLLIPDAAQAVPHPQKEEHKVYPLRLVDGKPYLPPTSIKGMLRSAYEAVTNSRFTIFEKHGERLAFRQPVKQGVIPTRVELRGKPGEEQLYLRLLEKSDLSRSGYAAKLPRYDRNSTATDKGQSRAARKYPDGTLPQHEDAVWVSINQGIVTEIRKRSKTDSPPSSNCHKGWVCITGANIKQKIYERVFIESKDDQVIGLNDELRKLWKELILNYQSIHADEIEKRRKNRQTPQAYLGSDPDKTGFSLHVYSPNQVDLREGILCYTELSDEQVQNLLPVTISRCLYAVSPLELLDSSLRPATQISDLSPADRVFGWVNQEKGSKTQGAYKGHLRIHSVYCNVVKPEDAIDDFRGESFPLAILGAPKPQQARFYTASDHQGTPLSNRSKKESGYTSQENGLRGRKVYPHHQVPSDHWVNPQVNRTQTPDHKGHFQEYRHPANGKEALSDQNRSIQAWVKPDIEFTFKIEVTNLSSFELGALLWLLKLPESHYHRLGGGKPLGFGSVQLSIDSQNTDLRQGYAWKNYYLNFADTVSSPDVSEIDKLIEAYKETAISAFGAGQRFEDIELIKAFLVCTQGFNDGKPIHYPRAKPPNYRGPLPPHPEGKAFEWFVANERPGQQAGVSLPPLWDDKGLPLLERSKQ